MCDYNTQYIMSVRLSMLSCFVIVIVIRTQSEMRTYFVICENKKYVNHYEF